MHNPVLLSKILTCKSTTFDLTECASGVCLCVRGRGWIGIFLPESPWHIKESEFGKLKQSLLWEQFENRECTQCLLFHGVMGRWGPQEGKSVKKTYYFQWKVYERKGKEWLINFCYQLILSNLYLWGKVTLTSSFTLCLTYFMF